MILESVSLYVVYDLYGFDLCDDVIRMTLLRSARDPTKLRKHFGLTVDKEAGLTDQGEHHIAYALYPHSSGFRDALTARKAYELHYPLMAHVEPTHRGELPKVHSFTSAQPDNIILTGIKKAEDSDDIVLRFYETSGKDMRTVIHITEILKGATETDLGENELSEIPVQGGAIEVATSKCEIKTVRIVHA